jgi:hypothetical protein
MKRCSDCNRTSTTPSLKRNNDLISLAMGAQPRLRPRGRRLFNHDRAIINARDQIG